MDRKGKQKISFICLMIGAIVLLAIMLFCKVLYEKKIFEDQKKELSVIYPEFADELSENISYYASISIQTDFLIILIAMLLIVIVLAGTYYILTSANRGRCAEAENELNYVYEQLLRFQNGNVDMLPTPEESSSQKFEDVYDFIPTIVSPKHCVITAPLSGISLHRYSEILFIFLYRKSLRWYTWFFTASSGLFPSFFAFKATGMQLSVIDEYLFSVVGRAVERR